MSDYNLGTARGTIELTYRDNGSPGRASSALGGVGESASKSHKAVVIAGTGIITVATAIAAGLGVAINAAAGFNTKLSEIQAVSGATSAQMSQVSAKALQLGKDTTFSAGDAADAISELVKAGVSLPDVLNGAADATVALAAAGGIELPKAATIASNAMNQFKLKASDLPKVADLLAGAANASSISVQDLGDSLAYVGPVANAMGVSIGDTSTALAILGNNGIKGSAGGTALRSILSQLTPTTKMATAEFTKLGLITKNGANQFYDATGKVKPLDQVIGILHDSMKGLTKQQQATFTKKAFGLEDLAAVSALAGETGTSFDAMTASIAKVKAADVAKTKMNNLHGSVEQLKGSVETLEIEVGEKLQGPLKGAADTANQFIGVLIDMVSSPQVAAFFGNLQKQVTSFTNGVRLAAPVVQKVFAALFGALYGSKAASGGGASFFDQVKTGVAGIVTSVRDAYTKIAPIVVQIVSAFAAKWDEYAPKISKAIAQYKAIIIDVLNLIAADIKVWVAIISYLWDHFGATLLDYATATFNNILNLINGVLTVIRGVLDVFIGLFTGDWSRAWLGVQEIFSGVWTAIKAILSQALAEIQLLLGIVWAAIKAAAGLAWDGIKAVITLAINALVAYVTSQFNATKAGLDAIWSAIKTAASTAWNGVKAAISAEIDGIIAVVQGIQDRVISAVSGAVSWLGSAGRSVITGFTNGIGAVITTVATTAGEINGKVTAALAGAGSWLLGAGQSVIQGLINGMENMAGNLADKVKGLADKVTGPFKKALSILSPSKVFHGFGTNIVQGLVNGIDDTRSKVASSMNKLATATHFTGQSGGYNLADVATMASGSDAAVRSSSNYGASAPRDGSVGGNTYINNNISADKNVTVTNPPAKTTEDQVVDSLRKMDIIYGSKVNY